MQTRLESVPLHLRIAPAQPTKFGHHFYCSLTIEHIYIHGYPIYGATPEEAYARCAKLIEISVGDWQITDQFGRRSSVRP
jgi:hypothetical protein